MGTRMLRNVWVSCQQNIDCAGNEFRKRTLQEAITAGFRYLKVSHGEDELDYSVVFQSTELGSVNGRKGKWIWTQHTED